MAILVGIDEAGYGPLLGPLVVSSAVFRMGDELLRADLWDVLQKAVSPQKRGSAGRVLITDSKKAYSRSSGIKHLRRTVHACLGATCDRQDQPIHTAAQLIQELCPDCAGRITEYPWYNALNEHILEQQPDEIQIASGVLKRTMAENDIHLVGIHSKCLDVAFYNNRVAAVKNKSRVLFTALCSLILDVINTTPANDMIQIIVDRQGGRVNYQQELLRMFPGFSLSVIRQDEKMSSYELITSNRTIRVHFCVKADSKYLPVCLASMASKYLREVLMESLNNFFSQRCKELKPTAGYWQDGQRFIKDIESTIPSLSINYERLVRNL
ncbi:MAG: hypothetical protein H8E62_01030 [Planctomycetes bacterium]|nr:hypothetical protein [Planctomycetota bacterium]